MKTKEDFLSDPEFIRWVKEPDRELDLYWERWIKANPDHLPTLRLAKELLTGVRYEAVQVPPGAKEDILNQILKEGSSIKASGHEREGASRSGHGLWSRMGQFERVAAILLVSFALGWLAWMSLDRVLPVEHVVQETALIRKTTAPGEKLQVTLSDGTRIWMNSASELEFPEKFDSLERIVSVRGEVFFEVEKDTLRPFQVVTEGMTTTVLGTSFNINTKDNGRISVSLLTGKVSVKPSAESEAIFLKPGEAINYHIASNKHQVSHFDIKETTAWREGWMIFNRASLSQVVNKLEDWYGVKIHLANSPKEEWQLSAEYQHQTLENVLKSLSYIQEFEFTIHGKEVELKF